MKYKIIQIDHQFQIMERIPETSVFLKMNLSGRLNSFYHIDQVIRYIRKNIAYKGGKINVILEL